MKNVFQLHSDKKSGNFNSLQISESVVPDDSDSGSGAAR